MLCAGPPAWEPFLAQDIELASFTLLVRECAPCHCPRGSKGFLEERGANRQCPRTEEQQTGVGSPENQGTSTVQMISAEGSSLSVLAEQLQPVGLTFLKRSRSCCVAILSPSLLGFHLAGPGLSSCFPLKALHRGQA